MSNKYITTAIPYLNGRPHIGHLMDYLLADIWARWQRQQGNMVRVSAGTDEHGTKVAQKAAEAGVTQQQFVDSLVPVFQDLIHKLEADYTDFMRTTNPDHERRCQEIWQKLDAAGLIYKGQYKGWYCSGCEAFLTESEAKSMDYVCSDHDKPLESIEEENHFLKVSHFTDEIREFAKNNIVPDCRGKEVLELIKDGAQDVSISRPTEKLSWGIPVPGNEAQTMYVWVDALSNYITVLGYPDKDISEWWPADVEAIGKDILRFHAVIWPAILLGLGLELPKKLLVHGHIMLGGQKMSKTLGNVIDPIELLDEYGAESVRYYFTRHIPTLADGDFTEGKFVAAYNCELANDLGNLVSRTANMVEQYLGGDIAGLPNHPYNSLEYQKAMEDFRFDKAIEIVWKSVQAANRYIDEQRPWEVAKNGGDVKSILVKLVAEMRILAVALAPFLPSTSEKMTSIFGGEKLGKSEILFPKIDV